MFDQGLHIKVFLWRAQFLAGAFQFCDSDRGVLRQRFYQLFEVPVRTLVGFRLEGVLLVCLRKRILSGEV